MDFSMVSLSCTKRPTLQSNPRVAHEIWEYCPNCTQSCFSIAEKEALSIVYAQGAMAFDKSGYYDAFVYDNKPSIFSTTDRDDHALKRRLISHAFSAKSLEQFTDIIQDILMGFVRQMDKICFKEESVDALVWLNYLAFDILSDLAFGKAIGMVENGSDFVAVQTSASESNHLHKEHAITLVDEREHMAAVMGVLSRPLRFLSRFLPDPFFIRARKATLGLGDLARSRVLQRLNFPVERDDMLEKLIAARKVGGEPLTQDQITELTAEAVTLLIAGSETTSGSLTAILFHVLNYPLVYEKLLQTLENAVTSEIPTYDEVKNIAYLDAVIDEGLRFHATIAIGLHRKVPKDGIMCCGKFFSGGTELSVPAWTIQRDPNIWGDPDIFRPERWLEQNANKSYLLTFGKGPRACLGRNLAYLEMRLILATLLLRYNMQLQSDELVTTEGFTHKPCQLMIKLSRK
ncbi:hypothetical protein M422DRAFT_263446 [Sphaerobolus stellatus SS14]|uniref:Cytochrome P450 n=1 Tax=Sphaerobolus stellatus (strain SS14) TaxID=990650 RepID=A0A0C9TVX2_SPHS4|nr:hypothetical protein M422DRAFT_263446 [Sphaerobolus stellatus SS14]